MKTLIAGVTDESLNNETSKKSMNEVIPQFKLHSLIYMLSFTVYLQLVPLFVFS